MKSHIDNHADLFKSIRAAQANIDAISQHAAREYDILVMVLAQRDNAFARIDEMAALLRRVRPKTSPTSDLRREIDTILARLGQQ